MVDYSAPNVAKEMHVGHLRTTIIGDALVRMLEFVGHTVIRENHIGDWGTPFGMLIEHLVDLGGVDAELTVDLADPSAFYQAGPGEVRRDDEFKERARDRVVAAAEPRRPGHDGALAEARRHSRPTTSTSSTASSACCCADDDIVGESFYQPLDAGDARPPRRRPGCSPRATAPRSCGCPGFTNREGEPLPLIVQARTGGFNYATSDLACVIDRVERLHATLLLYVIGTPQASTCRWCSRSPRWLGWLRAAGAGGAREHSATCSAPTARC